MAEGLRPYPAYKPSGVEWLGDVPAHWDVFQLGRMGRFFKGNGGTKADETEEGIPCVRYGDLYTKHSFHITEARSRVDPLLAETAYTPIQYGDVLFAGSGETVGEIGKSAANLMRGPACCGGDVIVFRPNGEMEPAFLGYATDCLPAAQQKARMGRGFTVVHIYGTDLKYLSIAVPPPSEQVLIARFLDHATSRIERYIRTKEKLIALLEEQKRAMIHEAVTGRVDVRTGKAYGTYKPSGIKWLCDVPAHWHVRPAKWHLREVDERSVTGAEETLSVSHLTGVTPRSEKSVTMFEAESNVGHKLCSPGDVVVNTMWAWMGALGVAQQSGLVSPSYAVYRPMKDSSLDRRYTEMMLRSGPLQCGYVMRSTGIRPSRLRLYPDTFLRIRLMVPPPQEQSAIVAFVTSETARYDHAASLMTAEANALREYRARLVADVVTGKLDVRRAAADLDQQSPSGRIGVSTEGTDPNSRGTQPRIAMEES